MARKPVTMADVGAAAGVSDRTVSNVLTGRVPVRPATRDAVLRAVQDLGYQVNVFARSLRTARTGFITLAIPDLSLDYFAALARAVLHEADQVGWAVTLQQTGSRRERELEILSGADRRLTDGLIFQPHALGSEDQDALVTGQPMVLLGDRIHRGPVDHVTMANTAAAQQATRHLLQLGRRRIAVVGPNPADTSTTASTLRWEGYRRALVEAGLPVRQELVGPAARWGYEDGVAAVEDLLRTGVEFDALFCFNDTLALGALTALARRGVRVPQDVAVVGFDNVPAAAHSTPALTTIDPGTSRIAREAVRLLAARTLDGDVRPPVEFVAEHALVVRDSA